MVLISGAGHLFAAAAKDLVTSARFVEMKALPALKAASADAATIEAVVKLASPDAANVERAAFAALGVLIQVIETGGTNWTLDAELIAAVKAIIPAVKGQIPAAGAAAAAQASA